MVVSKANANFPPNMYSVKVILFNAISTVMYRVSKPLYQ
jgi:hypothetical protein